MSERASMYLTESEAELLGTCCAIRLDVMYWCFFLRSCPLFLEGIWRLDNWDSNADKDESLLCYFTLAARAVREGACLWPVRPKCHDPCLYP